MLAAQLSLAGPTAYITKQTGRSRNFWAWSRTCSGSGRDFNLVSAGRFRKRTLPLRASSSRSDRFPAGLIRGPSCCPEFPACIKDLPLDWGHTTSIRIIARFLRNCRQSELHACQTSLVNNPCRSLSICDGSSLQSDVRTRETAGVFDPLRVREPAFRPQSHRRFGSCPLADRPCWTARDPRKLAAARQTSARARTGEALTPRRRRAARYRLAVDFDVDGNRRQQAR